MLAGEHHGVNAVGFAVDITHGDLAFGIGPQKGQLAAFAKLRLALHHAVRIVDGRRHEFGCFVAGVTKHQALVARASVHVVVRGVVDALGDVIGLFVIGHQHGAAFVINAVVGVVVTDAFDGVTRHLDVVDMGVGGDFTGQHHQTGVAQCFSSYAGFGVLLEDCVQNRVGNLVRHLVGVALRDGFGGEEKIVCHKKAPKVKNKRCLRCFVLWEPSANALADGRFLNF